MHLHTGAAACGAGRLHAAWPRVRVSADRQHLLAAYPAREAAMHAKIRIVARRPLWPCLGAAVARGALVQRSVVRVAAGWWAAGSTAVNNSRDCADPEDDGARSRVILVDGRDDLGDGKEPKAAVLSLPLQPRIALRCCMFGAACCAASCTSQARSYHRRKSHDASGTNSEWIWAQPRAAAALMAMRALAGTAASSRTRCEQA